MNEIDNLILEGMLSLTTGETSSKQSILSSPGAWGIFLDKARSYLPYTIRNYLYIGNGIVPHGMPPDFICDYHDFRLLYEGLVPVRVHFSATSDRITYEVPVWDAEYIRGIWDWSRAVTYSDLELALGDAKRQYNLREHTLFLYSQKTK